MVHYRYIYIYIYQLWLSFRTDVPHRISVFWRRQFFCKHYHYYSCPSHLPPPPTLRSRPDKQTWLYNQMIRTEIVLLALAVSSKIGGYSAKDTAEGNISKLTATCDHQNSCRLPFNGLSCYTLQTEVLSPAPFKIISSSLDFSYCWLPVFQVKSISVATDYTGFPLPAPTAVLPFPESRRACILQSVQRQARERLPAETWIISS